MYVPLVNPQCACAVELVSVLARPVRWPLSHPVFSLGLFGVVRTTWFVWCSTWLVPGNPFALLGLNINYDIHSATRLISNSMV